MFLTGEFTEAESTAAAIETLKSKGFDDQDLDVFSTEPVEFPPGVLDRESHMSLVAVGGAATLCLLAALFVRFTQYSFPLVTGGMPLFSFWATGVIFYEFTMLGAIAATFLTFLWESGVLRRSAQKSSPVPDLDSGHIYLRVRCRPEQASAAGECLYQAGAASVKKAEGSL